MLAASPFTGPAALASESSDSPEASALISPALSKIHTAIEVKYPHLNHVSAVELSALLSGARAGVLVLDVREDKEYAVSHIDGALRIDPDISPAEFMAVYGDQFAGQDVVFYCAVGRRSSRLVDKLEGELITRGARRVSNLKGGIFNWHNGRQPLVTSKGETDKVHPYNLWAGRLVIRKDGIAYKPEL